MSLWVPPVSFTGYQSNATDEATVNGTTITGPGSSHTKGTWQELIASTSFDAYAVQVYLGDTAVAATNTSCLVDIGIGASTDESVLIPNLNGGFAEDGVLANKFFFPLYVPAGSRLSARTQAAELNEAVVVRIVLLGKPDGPVWAGSTVTDYGTNLAASQGTAFSCSTTGEGAWTQVTASTSKTHHYLAAGLSGNSDTTVQGVFALLDIGVGAATEQAIMEHFPFRSTTSEIVYYGMIGGYAKIPSGTRLVVRAEGDAAQGYDCIFYGVS